MNYECVGCGKRYEQEPKMCMECGFNLFSPCCPAVPSAPFVDLGASIGRVVTEKQAAYGDSFGKSGAVMRILYPDGITADKMDDALCLVRILDKMFRIATDRDALGESPYRDIAGYALLGAARTNNGGSK